MSIFQWEPAGISGQSLQVAVGAHFFLLWIREEHCISMYWGARGWPSIHCTKLLFQIHLSSSAKCLPHQFVPYLAMLSISQDNGISSFDLSSDIPLYTLATIHFIILYYVFVHHILLYPFVISCVQILYSQLSLRLPRENSALPLASLSHQSCVKYITDVFVNTCWIKLN